MSELSPATIGLIGVIIGSIVTYFGQYFLFKFEYKKWRKEKKIEILKSRKADLEAKYEKYGKKIINALQEPNLDAEMGADILINFPKNVCEAFTKAVKAKGSIKKDEMSKNYHNILFEMKKSLLEIDKEIDKKIDEK